MVLGAALSVLLVVMIVSTDEGEATFGERLGRFASLVALAGGLAAFVTTEQAHSRGELRGLGAVGVAPARAPLGAALGGMLVAAVGPALALLRAADLDCLYPRLVSSAGTWAMVGEGVWRQASGGVVVRAAGEIDVSTRMTVGFGTVMPQVPRLSTSAALLAFAIAVPLWATARGTTTRRLAVALLVVIVSVTLFHLVAVARAPSGFLLIPPAVLLLDAWALGSTGESS
jgi:hypothetical protein